MAMGDTKDDLDVLTLDVTIDPYDFQPGILRVLHDIRPAWKVDDVRFEPMQHLFLNQMVKVNPVDSEDNATMFRIYTEQGTQYDFPVDRSLEQTATRVLNEIRACPKLNCVFNNGVCFDFVVGETLSFVDLSVLDDVKRAKSVMRELANVHCERTKSLALNKYGLKERPHFITDYLDMFLNYFPKSLRCDEPVAVHLWENVIPSVATLKKEAAKLMAMVETLGLTSAFCHNDTHPRNMVYDPTTDKTTLLDFDFSGFGVAEMDIALFLTLSGLGYNPAGPEAPRRQDWYWKEALEEYIVTKKRLDQGREDVTVNKQELERLFVVVKKLSLVFMFAFPIWMMHDACIPGLPVTPKQYLELAINVRDNWYLKNREDILKLEVGPS